MTMVLLAPFFAIILFAFIYPIGNLLSISFLEPSPTLDNYARVVTNPIYALVLARTAWISLLVTVLAVVLGFPVAYFMTRVNGAVAALVAACVLLPFWSSVLVRTAAWAVLLQREGVINTILLWLGVTSEPLRLLYTQGAVVIAMTHVLLPFMILPIYGALRNIPDDYMRAASVLGAGRFRAFAEVMLPLSLPGVWSGSILVFLTALGFFVTPALLGSPQEMMIATLVSQQVREVLDWPFAAALVGVLTLFVTLIAMIFSKAIRFERLMGSSA
ncbi:ABC transporter permease [Mesorhizobium sp. ANAO-SY3R2]|uniref:ABC transporter permease n=1 Tax=Mesorhizobium sp. ANAO-SY3R2 TaxID=3166644 RepID=UPI00366F5C3A